MRDSRLTYRCEAGTARLRQPSCLLHRQRDRRHGGCGSPLDSSNVIGGNRRAASASARGTGRTAYTKDVSRMGHAYRTLQLSMKSEMQYRDLSG